MALAIFLLHHRRSSYARDWCAAKEVLVLAELVQLEAVEELGEENLLAGKAAHDGLIQTVEEAVVTVSSHWCPTWSFAEAHLAPTNLLMQSSLSSR
jgi:hypothetical protein